MRSLEEGCTPGAEPWGLPTFISQGEEGANRRDRENIARGGGKPGESCVCKVRLDQVVEGIGGEELETSSRNNFESFCCREELTNGVMDRKWSQ